MSEQDPSKMINFDFFKTPTPPKSKPFPRQIYDKATEGFKSLRTQLSNNNIQSLLIRDSDEEGLSDLEIILSMIGIAVVSGVYWKFQSFFNQYAYEIIITVGLLVAFGEIVRAIFGEKEKHNRSSKKTIYAVVLDPHDKDGNKRSHEELNALAQECFDRGRKKELKAKFDFK